MAAWGERGGAEAIHTATFFGHPIACAAALAALEVMDEERVEEQARERGARWLEMLRAVGFGHPTVVREVRGRGMLFALELEGAPRTTLRAVPALLERGYITLPAGRNAEVLQLLPPVLIDDALATLFAAALDEVLEEVAR
jgi:acetylornithine/succinyldiaminopimelate/putrescine aminotransferase